MKKTMKLTDFGFSPDTRVCEYDNECREEATHEVEFGIRYLMCKTHAEIMKCSFIDIKEIA